MLHHETRRLYMRGIFILFALIGTALAGSSTTSERSQSPPAVRAQSQHRDMYYSATPHGTNSTTDIGALENPNVFAATSFYTRPASKRNKKELAITTRQANRGSYEESLDASPSRSAYSYLS